ncbi:Asp23/Gls24 family envelope stress response protein [Streptomyces sp. CoT10]|uniref:Asp23/Gls24 family envelope stress response protein n=1 Tax=Streptomyces sp. CoT10 TaxID=2875762 RepID=UPI001CD24D75|nr:Asp23/Gls24 family envelope stress response protein [Streptomyces sp. CoT10]
MALDDPHARPSEPPGDDGAPGHPAIDDAAPLAGDEVLTCGRLLSQVWEQAQDATPTADPHTMSCPQCREAVEGLARLNAATRALRAKDPPGLQALTDRVMCIVRAEVRLGRLLPLADTMLDLLIAESAAAKVLRHAADMVPGARAVSCRLVPAGGTAVRVTMTLAAALDRPLPDRVDQVREAIVDAAGHALGLDVTAVDIIVVDVLEPPVQVGPAGSGQTTGGGA